MFRITLSTIVVLGCRQEFNMDGEGGGHNEKGLDLNALSKID